MRSTVINTSLGDIEYCSDGKGIPVIFIHGGHSNCHETLSYNGFDLSRFQLITPSRPGYGKTPLAGNCTPKQAADLIAELLTCLALERVVVYGISAGGLTAIELAVNHPEKVQKLILASAISKKWLNKGDSVYKIARVIFHPRVECATWAMVRFFSKLLPGMIAKSFYSEFSSYPKYTFSSSDTRALVSALKHYRSHSGFLNDIDQDIREETVEKVGCPTLVVHSRYDNSVSFSHALHSSELIANTRLLELKNKWGHLFWIGGDSKHSIMRTIEFIEE